MPRRKKDINNSENIKEENCLSKPNQEEGLDKEILDKIDEVNASLAKEKADSEAAKILDKNIDEILTKNEEKQLAVYEKNETQPDKRRKKSISYKRPVFHRRVLANLIDFLLFLLVFSSTFIGLRAIINTTEKYNTAQTYLHDMQIKCGLYSQLNDTDKRLVGIAHALDIDANKNSLEKKTALSQHIDTFVYKFAPKYFSEEDALAVEKDYDSYRLNLVMAGTKDTHYFIDKTLPNGETVILENPELFDGTSSANLNMQYRYFNDVYTPYSNKAQGLFLSKTPHVYEYQDYIGKMLMFVELPVSFIFGALIVYLVPPLIFRRNRYTIGKLLYKIGLVNSNYLRVKNWQIIVRQLIVVFLELVLSCFTFAAPALISFTMMCFSKKKQGFPDYMLGCEEVDLTSEKIYYSKEEIYLEILKSENGPIQYDADKKNYEQ